MRRATTPTIQIDSDVNLKDFEWFRLTFAQRNGPRVIKTEKDCTLSEDGKTIYVRLSQQETLSFSDRYNLMVQMRYGIGDTVNATNIVSRDVGAILDEEVI